MATDTFGGSGNLTGNWTVVTGAFNQSGGVVYGNSANASAYAYWNADTFTDDQEAWIIADPLAGSNYIGPAVRCATGAFTCANLDVSSGDLYISTWSAGTQTVVAGPLAAPTAGDKVTLRAVGTTLSYYFNDVLQNSYTPGGLPSSGRLGITAYNDVGTGASEWTGTSLGAAAPTTTSSGPTQGVVNVASSNFTFGLDAAPPGDVVITPHSDKAGSFSPTTVTATVGTWSGLTATFTATVTGTHTITTTNDGSLSNAASLTYESLVRHYPSADVTTTGWTASTGTDFYATIDESVRDDADYDTSPNVTGSQGPLVLTMTPSLAAGTHTLRFASRWITEAAEMKIDLVNNSNTVQGSSSWMAIDAAATETSTSIVTTGEATRFHIDTRSPVKFALRFPSNISGSDTTAPFVAIQYSTPQSNGLPIWGPADAGCTYVWKVKPHQQTGYYAFWWWSVNGDFLWDGGSSNTYYGCHPYPQSGTNAGTTHWWELATGGGDRVDTRASTNVTVTQESTRTQGLRVIYNGDNTKTMVFYLNLPSVANGDVIEYTVAASWGETYPGSTAFTIGDSPWYASYQHERASCDMDSFKIFATLLSEADMLDEAANFNSVQTAGGLASIWWGKNGFASLDDLTCSYGTGRTFAWADGGNKGTLVTRL